MRVTTDNNACQFTVSWNPPATGNVGDYWIYVSPSGQIPSFDEDAYPQPGSAYADNFGYLAYVDTGSTATSATFNFNSLPLGEPCNASTPLQAAWVGVAAESPGWDNGIPVPVSNEDPVSAWMPLSFTDSTPANGSTIATLPTCPTSTTCPPLSVPVAGIQDGTEADYAMTVTDGTLPVGMTASTTTQTTGMDMAATGVPTQAGDYAFQVTMQGLPRTAGPPVPSRPSRSPSPQQPP